MDQDQQQLRNLRDFLLVYNRMTETCFQRCTSNFNYRNLTMNEERCVDSCAGKLIRSNHRLMGTYVQLMPGIVQRRMEEMEAKAGEMGQSAEAGTSIGTVPAATSTLADGTVAESMTVLAPTSAGLVEEIPPFIAPPSDGVTVDIPPILAPTAARPPLSETLRSLPDLAAPPPISPPEALPPLLPVNPSSSTSNGQLPQSLSSGLSTQDSQAQPPTERLTKIGRSVLRGTQRPLSVCS
ncbi:hypothetical protein GJAV_G00133990 [Gymnothorax javanicus]|nr:hypothetical protein GJAV_G00133990 [Gymnothorax javanicus]